MQLITDIMLPGRVIASLLIICSSLAQGEEQVHVECEDLAKYRTDFIVSSFDSTKANGFFYENAYQDLAQVGSSCGYYSKNSTESGDVFEWFGFTYVNPNHMMLKYTSQDDIAVYTKKIDKGDDGFGPPIASVVVV